MADYSYETFHQLLLEWKEENGRVPSKKELANLCGISVKDAQQILDDVKADLDRAAKKRKLQKDTAPAEDQDETLPMAEASEPGEDESDLEEALEKEFEKDSCPSGPASSAVPTAAAPTSQDRRGALAVCESGQPVKSEPGIPAPVSKAESAGLDHETSPKAEAKGAKPECADTLLDVKEPGSQSTAAAGGRLDKSRCH